MASRTRLGLASNGHQDAAPSALAALLARVEAADGPDWELDRRINEVLDNNEYHSNAYYTASLDAALALVERVAGQTFISVCNTFGDWHAEVGESKATAPTPALALLAAMLKALLGSEPAEPQSGNARQLGTPKSVLRDDLPPQQEDQ